MWHRSQFPDFKMYIFLSLHKGRLKTTLLFSIIRAYYLRFFQLWKVLLLYVIFVKSSFSRNYFFVLGIFDLKLLSSLKLSLSQLLIPLVTPLSTSDKNCLAFSFFSFFSEPSRPHLKAQSTHVKWFE